MVTKFKRVDGKLIKITTQTPFQKQILQRSVRRFQEQERIKAINLEARRLDKAFTDNNFGGSVQTFTENFNLIKTKSPEVASALKVNPATVQADLNTRIKSIETSLQSSSAREQKARKKDDNARREKERATQKGLVQGLQRLKAGELLTVNAITSFAGKLGSQAFDVERDRERRREAKKKARKKITPGFKAPKGKISATTLKIGGKVITGFVDDRGQFSPSGAPGMAEKFAQVKKAFGTTSIAEIEKIKNIPSVKKELNVLAKQQRGFELLQVKIQIEQASDRQKLNVALNKALGGFSKVLTTQQKQNILAGQRVSKIPISKIKTLQDIKVIKPEVRSVGGFFNKALKLSGGKQFRKTLESFAKENIKKAEAGQLGKRPLAVIQRLAQLPGAFLDTVLEIGAGIESILNTPVPEILLALSNIRKSDVTSAGANFGKRIARGEPKALTAVAIMLTPFKVPGSSAFLGKIAKDINKIGSAESKFKFKQNLNTGAGSIEIITKGINQANQRFDSLIKLALRPKDKTIFGTNTLKINGKVTKQKITLKDEGAFFVDRVTGLKIPKSSVKLERVKVIEKVIKTKLTKTKDVFRVNFTGTINYGKRIVQKKKVFIEKGKVTRVQISKKVKLEQALGRNINEIATTKRFQTLVKSSVKKSSIKKTPKEFEDMTKFLESIRYDKEILNGIDKRTRLAFALGINQKAVGSLIKRIDQDIKTGYIIIRKSKLTATGRFETINPQRFMLGPSFAFSKPLLVFKKAFKTKKGIKTPQEIKIPRLNSIIYLPTKLPRGVKIPGSFLTIAAQLGLADKYDFERITSKQKTKTIQKIKDKFKVPIKVPVKIQKKFPIQKKIQKKIVKPIKKLKLVTKIKKKVVKPIKPLKKFIVKPVKKIKKLPKIILTFNTKLNPGERLMFGIRFRERKSTRKPFHKRTNPVIIKKINLKLPLNRAVKKGFGAVDNTLQRSAVLFITGVTRKKDIAFQPKLKKKFTIRKGKTALKFVEKPKHLIDTSGEKKGLALSRALKPKKKKVVKKRKKKTIKKGKRKLKKK